MTAIHLLHLLRQAGCDPLVDGQKLKLKAAPPAAIAKYLCPLQTGVRSVLTRKAWYFTARPKESRPAGGLLDPAKKIPHTVNLLTVEGDAAWDKVHPAWLDDMPELFTAPKEK